MRCLLLLRHVVDGIRHQVVEVKTLLSELCKEVVTTVESFLHLPKEIAVAFVEKTRTARCGFANEQRCDAIRTKALAQFLYIVHVRFSIVAHLRLPSGAKARLAAVAVVARLKPCP